MCLSKISWSNKQNYCTPYEGWCGIKLNASSLCIFGCSAYAHVPEVERLKVDPKEGVIIDYGQKGYRLYGLEKW